MLSRRGVVGALAATALRGQKGSKMFGDAEAYERFMGRWSRQMAPLLAEFARVPASGRVLDVGSGTGAMALAMAERSPRLEVVGIDPSQEYVAFAQSRNRAGERVKFETGDAQKLRFADGSFDGSVSLLVFNFIPDRAKALREVRRVTKAGGSVSAAVWDYGEGMRMLRAFWDAAVAMDASAERMDERHMPLCRGGELGALWKEGGLRDVEERPLEFEMEFGSFADYWDTFLLGQGPGGAYVARLDDGRRAALRDEVRRRLGVRDEGAGFSLGARAWAVRGVVRG